MSKKSKTNKVGREKTTLWQSHAPAYHAKAAWAAPADQQEQLAARRRWATKPERGKSVYQTTVASGKVIRIGLPTHRSPNKVPALRSKKSIFAELNKIKKESRDLLNKLSYVNPARTYT